MQGDIVATIKPNSFYVHNRCQFKFLMSSYKNSCNYGSSPKTILVKDYLDLYIIFLKKSSINVQKKTI